MKFKVGDKVKQLHHKDVGTVAEAYYDRQAASGEWYLIDFGPGNGNQWSDGQTFRKISDEL